MDKKKIVKICIAFVAIILLVLCIYYGRNYYIIDKISKMQEKYMNSNNYSLVLEPEKHGDIPQITIEQYYKDGSSKEILKLDGELWYSSWHNKKEKVSVSINPSNNSASVQFSDFPNVTRIPILSDNFWQKLCMTFISKISSAEVNGEECYLIDWGAKTYISKETGLKLKEINGIAIDSDGIEYENAVYYKEVKINNVTDEDVTVPSLEGYDVKDYRENQKKFGGW